MDKVKCPDCKGEKVEPVTDGKGKEGFSLYGFEYRWFYCPICKKNFLVKYPKK